MFCNYTLILISNPYQMYLAYNVSGHLNDYLSKIEKLRVEILTYPLSPKNEVRLRWDGLMERIIWSLSLTDNTINKNDVISLLSSPPKRKLDKNEKEVLALKNAFSYIREEWLASKNPVTLTTIKKIYDLACKDSMGAMTGLTQYSEKRIHALCDYLQNGNDNPIIQAGITQAEIINITPFDNGNSRVARLMSYLLLYKGGYDFRGILNLEEYYKRDVVTYKRMQEMTKIQGNLTVWLEYFTFGVGGQLEKALEQIKNLRFSENLHSSFWKLNSRQREIMEALENPEEKISNKDVQKLYGISQITASRDLAKLTSLGLLLIHGKGRSVYYTRV